jgi:hypothetical protein
VLLGLALGLVALAATVTLRAQAMTPITVINCAAGFPSCGWTYRGNNPHYTLSQVGTGARFALTSGSSPTLTQFYMGWYTSVPQAAQGSSRYIRLRIRVASPVNPAGVGDVWTDKFIILGDGGDSTSRVIVELRPWYDQNGEFLVTRIQQNIAGDEARTPTLRLVENQLVSLQFEARSGSAGRVAMWMDNNNYAAPSAVSPNFNLSAAAWNNIAVGAYSNASVAAAGHIVFEVTDFQYDDEFDPNWSGGGTTFATPPTAATRTALP